MKINRSAGFAFSAAILWSTVASAFKIGLGFASVELLLLISVLFSNIVFIIFNLYEQGSFLPNNKKDWALSAVMGLMNPFAYYLILFKAYSLLPAQEALSLNYTWTITIVVFSILILKQKIGIRSIVSLLISLAGVIIIAVHGNFNDIHLSNTLGVCLGAGSSLIWGLYWTLSLKDKRRESEKLSHNFMFGLAYLILYNYFNHSIILLNYKMILSGAYIGFFEMGITFILWHLALKNAVNSSLPANIILLSPFLSLLIISIVLNEAIEISTWTGLCLIILGLLIRRRESE